MIEINIDKQLEKCGRSFYWLSKETGVSYTTLWRLKKGNALGINFSTLMRLCNALECRPGDLLDLADTGETTSGDKSVRSDGKAERNNTAGKRSA